jgi:hypothetical protein
VLSKAVLGGLHHEYFIGAEWCLIASDITRNRYDMNICGEQRPHTLGYAG